MNQPLRIETTVNSVRDIAVRLREAAGQVDRLADVMEEKQEWEVTSDVIALVTGLLPNLRLDTLASRPLREHRYRIATLEQQAAGAITQNKDANS